MTKDQEYLYIIGKWTVRGFIAFSVLAVLFWFFSSYLGLRSFELMDTFPLLGVVLALFGFIGFGHASVRTAEESEPVQNATVTHLVSKNLQDEETETVVLKVTA